MSTTNDQQGFGAVLSRILNSEAVVSTMAILTFLGFWALLGEVFQLKDVVSSPLLVAEDTYNILVGMAWVDDMVATIRRVVYAFVFSLILGTIVGVAMGMSKFWEKVFQDYVVVSMAFPGLFAVVFTAMWFGVSDVTPMVAAAIVVFGFTALMIFEGVRDIDNDYLEMARAFDIPRRRVVRRVMIPDLMAEWFAAARYAFGVSWKIVVLAEFIVAQRGIGYQLHDQMSTLQLTGVLSWTVLFMAVMVVWEYGVLATIEKRLFSWRDDEQIMGRGI